MEFSIEPFDELLQLLREGRPKDEVQDPSLYLQLPKNKLDFRHRLLKSELKYGTLRTPNIRKILDELDNKGDPHEMYADILVNNIFAHYGSSDWPKDMRKARSLGLLSQRTAGLHSTIQSSGCLMRCYQAMAEFTCGQALTVQQINDAFEYLKAAKDITEEGYCGPGQPIIEDAFRRLGHPRRLSSTPFLRFNFNELKKRSVENMLTMYIDEPEKQSQRSADYLEALVKLNCKEILLSQQREDLDVPEDYDFIILHWNGTHFTLANRKGEEIFEPETLSCTKTQITDLRLWKIH